MGTIQIDGSTPKLTIGNATAEDALIVFDGNAQDFYIGLDDSADDLVIGLGSAAGTTPAISINEDRDVTISDGAIDFDIASHDTSNGLKLGGTLVTAPAAELNIMDGVGATAAEINLIDGSAKSTSSITVADADGIIIIDGTTTKQIPASDLKTYAGFTATTITGTTALAVPPAVTDELILSDAGTLKRIDYEHLAMTPVFFVVKNATQAIATATVTDLTWETETLDSNGKFASNVFTPTVAGYYWLQASALIEYANAAGEYGALRIELNDADTGLYMRNIESGDTTMSGTLQVSGVMYMDGDDTAKVSIYHTQGGSQNIDNNTSYTRFCGFRICGV